MSTASIGFENLALQCVSLGFVTAASIANVLSADITDVESVLNSLALKKKVLRVNSALPYYKAVK